MKESKVVLFSISTSRKTEIPYSDSPYSYAECLSIQKEIDKYLNQGYEIKSTAYGNGLIVILERER